MRYFLTILVACFLGTVARADVICSVVESSICQQNTPTPCDGYCKYYAILGKHLCNKSNNDPSIPVEIRSTSNTYDGFRTADPGEPGYLYFTIVGQVKCSEQRTCATECEPIEVLGVVYYFCTSNVSATWESTNQNFTKLQGTEPCLGDGGINP